MKTKIGIIGYGNIGRSVESEIKKYSDLELIAIFSRRNAEDITSESKIYSLSDIKDFVGKIDVMLLCYGSAKDLPKYSRIIAKDFNTVDCYDVHSKIYGYHKNLGKINKKHSTVSIISVGWDPGLFSYSKLLYDSIIPNADIHTFWGSGVSQGHSEAIRILKGVKFAVSYTHPNEKTIQKIKDFSNEKIKMKDKHTRECFLVLEKDTPENRKNVEKKIKTMPNYFEGYETTVNYITQEEFKKDHMKMPHAGFTLAIGNTGNDNKQIAKFSLKLGSNPEFTANIMLAYARAAHKFSLKEEYGTYTIFDIPIKLISDKKEVDLIKKLL